MSSRHDIDKLGTKCADAVELLVSEVHRLRDVISESFSKTNGSECPWCGIEFGANHRRWCSAFSARGVVK